jgi:all-trans-8'-apo-beta-carotenal 15,15'-oxygenase
VPTLTRNLFRGAGEGEWELDVVDGHWPDDLDGHVFVVGPDKREPGGHWFGEWGLLHRIDCAAGPGGRVGVRARRVSTPVERLHRRLPRLFGSVSFAQLSPFGVSNLGNTNVEHIDGRLFLGYDAGRPLEVDPETLEVLTPVGSNGEWQQMFPGLIEPMVPVAAHPAPAWDERALYFVNYSPMPGTPTLLGRWGLNGPVETWVLDGMGRYDSIHDVKATEHHLVISELPFKVEPEAMRGGPRSERNGDETRLWIVPKAALRATAPGGAVEVTEVRIPLPTGHLSVDVAEVDGVISVNLDHIPLADLLITCSTTTPMHATGEPVPLDYEGLVPLGMQPGCIGRYRIDAASGEVLDAQVVWDESFWGGILTTHDHSTPQARARVDQLWFAGGGYDPELLPEEWWRLYADAGLRCLVEPADLPAEPRPGALAHFDLEAGKVAGVYEYADGSFPSPPTFVPRHEARHPGDGYVVVLVHADAGKEIQLFDAQDVQAGPVARATVPGFNPPLLLHSTWMPRRRGPRPSDYRVRRRDDVRGALTAAPSVVRAWVRATRTLAREQAAAAHGRSAE